MEKRTRSWSQMSALPIPDFDDLATHRQQLFISPAAEGRRVQPPPTPFKTKIASVRSPYATLRSSTPGTGKARAAPRSLHMATISPPALRTLTDDSATATSAAPSPRKNLFRAMLDGQEDRADEEEEDQFEDLIVDPQPQVAAPASAKVDVQFLWPVPSLTFPVRTVRLHQLTFVSELGRGHFGTVRRVRCGGGDEYAHKRQPLSVTDEVSNKHLQQLMFIKSRIGAMWLGMPQPPSQMVRVYQFWFEAGALHTLMDCCTAGTALDLAQRQPNGTFSHAQALRLAADMADCLRFLHNHDLLFNDIKPANVGVQQNGSFCLLDYDSVTSIAADSILRGTDDMDGDYISPEALQDTDKTTPASDVYALGVMLVNLLLGRKWSMARELKHATTMRSPSVEDIEYHLRTQLPLSIPSTFVHVLATMLNPSPDRRPTCAELLVQLHPNSLPAHSSSQATPSAFAH